MKTRFVSLLLTALALLLALPQPGQAPVAAAAALNAVRAPVSGLPAPRQDRPLGDVTGADTHYIYLPFVQQDGFSCVTGQSYGSFPPAGSDSKPPTGVPAASHPDKNLDVRGFVLDSGGGLGYTELGLGILAHDPSAPQLTTLFSPAPAAPFAHIYKVYGWNWGPAPTYGSRGALLGDTLLGIATTKGTLMQLPVRMSGDHPVAEYPAGTKYYGLVVYAAVDQITIVYISKDSIVNGSGQGYGLHVKNVCVDPNLLSLYNSLNAAGRNELPGLRYNQPFGVASGTEVDVAVRDSGNFMDPRSKQDWWVP
jgi:hypothetical protein